MLPGQNNKRSERKKLLQQQRLEKRRNWRLQNRKKAPAKPNQPTVDDYKRTVKGKPHYLARVFKLMLARWCSQPIKARVSERQPIIWRLQSINLKSHLKHRPLHRFQCKMNH